MRAESLLHDPRPHATQRAVLGDLFHEIVVRVEYPRNARAPRIRANAALRECLAVRDGVGERERNFLRRRAARVTHVITTDGNAVKSRHLAGAVADKVSREPQGRPRRIDIRSTRDVLLEHIVLCRARQRGGRMALLLTHRDVHRDE